MCDSLLWDYRGVSIVFIDNDIGLLFFNYCGSGFLLLIWFFFISGVILANIILLIFRYNDVDCDIVYMFVWIGMKFLLYIGFFVCFIFVVYIIWSIVFMGSWLNVLVVEFFVYRMRFVNMKNKRYVGYVFFLGSFVIMCI